MIHSWIKDGLRFEARNDSENQLLIFANESGGLSVVVSEEKAMDSYNATFECCMELNAKAAAKVRDYLNEHFPKENA